MKLNGFGCAMPTTSTCSWIALFSGLLFVLVCDCAVVNPDKLVLQTSPPFIEEVVVETGTVATHNKRDRDQKRRNRQRPTDLDDTHQPGTEDKPGEPNGYPSLYNPDDLQLGCTELRSKRYISDGFCTSMKPITEVVCAGECLPVRNLPWYAEYVKVWSTEKTKEWRCVNDVVRHKRIHLRCENGERRTYRIRTVRSCKCKKYNKKHNESRLENTNDHQVIDTSRTERKRNRQKGN